MSHPMAHPRPDLPCPTCRGMTPDPTQSITFIIRIVTHLIEAAAVLDDPHPGGHDGPACEAVRADLG